MFLAHGYAATTLTAVAEAARLAPRTVYVRFGTKAALLKRVVDVAVVGDTAPIDVISRDWFQTSLAREATRDSVRLFWSRMEQDGLLPPGCDLAWLADTSTLLVAADTYLLMTRTLGWDPDEYEAWMRTTWNRLIAASLSRP